MSRAALALLMIAIVISACGRRGDPDAPPGAYADPRARTAIEQTDDDLPVPEPITPRAGEEPE